MSESQTRLIIEHTTEIMNLKADIADRFYSLTISELQQHAINQIGCKLSDEELQSAIKMIIYGMNEGLDGIVNTAVTEAVSHRTIVYDT